MADGGYQGNPEVIMPYRISANGSPLAGWKRDLNTVHKQIRARVEHALAHMKAWNILRNCRRKRDGMWYATCGVAQMRNRDTPASSTPTPIRHNRSRSHLKTIDTRDDRQSKRTRSYAERLELIGKPCPGGPMGGLSLLERTCYLNSRWQMVRAVPSLFEQGLSCHPADLALALPYRVKGAPSRFAGSALDLPP